jgi:uncharacterized protein (TIGR02246 family)
MRRLPLAALFLCFPAYAFAGASEDGQAVFSKFIDGFNAANADTVAKVFKSDALFWGTRATDLITSNDGVHEYFANAFKALPGAKASIVGPLSTVALSESAVVVSGIWQVAAEIESKPAVIPLRNSVTIVKQGDSWLIVSFHNSPRPSP